MKMTERSPTWVSFPAPSAASVTSVPRPLPSLSLHGSSATAVSSSPPERILLFSRHVFGEVYSKPFGGSLIYVWLSRWSRRRADDGVFDSAWVWPNDDVELFVLSVTGSLNGLVTVEELVFRGTLTGSDSRFVKPSWKQTNATPFFSVASLVPSCPDSPCFPARTLDLVIPSCGTCVSMTWGCPCHSWRGAGPLRRANAGHISASLTDTFQAIPDLRLSIKRAATCWSWGGGERFPVVWFLKYWKNNVFVTKLYVHETITYGARARLHFYLTWYKLNH